MRRGESAPGVGQGHAGSREVTSDSSPSRQHFPLYRPSDANCSGEDAAPPEEKGIPFKERYDVLSREASQKVCQLTRLSGKPDESCSFHGGTGAGAGFWQYLRFSCHCFGPPTPPPVNPLLFANFQLITFSATLYSKISHQLKCIWKCKWNLELTF